MKTCPYCAEEIQDNAIKCRYCGEFLSDLPTQHTQIEPTPEEQRKRAEIQRLQRIASGVPSRADNLRKTKGLLALVIIIAILLYAYTWNKKHASTQTTAAVQSNITYEELNALFGPASPMPDELQQHLFAKYQGKRVTWKGQLTYINLGEGDELFVTLTQAVATMPTAGVQLRFRGVNKDQLVNLRTGQIAVYTGKIISYDAGARFFFLRDGTILSAE